MAVIKNIQRRTTAMKNMFQSKTRAGRTAPNLASQRPRWFLLLLPRRRRSSVLSADRRRGSPFPSPLSKNLSNNDSRLLAGGERRRGEEGFRYEAREFLERAVRVAGSRRCASELSDSKRRLAVASVWVARTFFSFF